MSSWKRVCLPTSGGNSIDLQTRRGAVAQAAGENFRDPAAYHEADDYLAARAMFVRRLRGHLSF